MVQCSHFYFCSKYVKCPVRGHITRIDIYLLKNINRCLKWQDEQCLRLLNPYICLIFLCSFRNLIFSGNCQMATSTIIGTARFPLGEFVRANRQKSRNASYLFAANFFASQFNLTNHVAGFLFSLCVARTNSPSGKRAYMSPLGQFGLG